MKYCGIDANVEVIHCFANEKVVKRFKGKQFKSYRDIAKQLKPGESVTVRVESTGKNGGLKNLLGFGEVSMEKDGQSFSEPRILSYEY